MRCMLTRRTANAVVLTHKIFSSVGLHLLIMRVASHSTMSVSLLLPTTALKPLLLLLGQTQASLCVDYTLSMESRITQS